MDNGILIDASTYKYLYKYENPYIKDQASLKNLYQFSNGTLSDAATYKNLYKIDGKLGFMRFIYDHASTGID